VAAQCLALLYIQGLVLHSNASHLVVFMCSIVILCYFVILKNLCLHFLSFLFPYQCVIVFV